MSTDNTNKELHAKKRRQLIDRNKRKEEQRTWHLWYIRIFTYLFAAFLAVSILLIPIRPKESVSEKRELAEFPKVSISALFTGSWFSGADSWFSDTFPFRDRLRSFHSGLEKLYGLKSEELYGATGQGDEIPETAEPAPVLHPEEALENADDEAAGTVYIADHRGYEVYYFHNDSSVSYASALNTVHEILGDSITIYDLLAPTAFSVCLNEQTQKSLGGSSARDAFNYIYSLLDPAIVKVPVIDTLTEHNAEYIYFNTDHSWTQLGAYYAYLAFCQAKGFTPNNLSSYTEGQYPGFLGSFYSDSNQSGALHSNPDTLITFTPIGTNECIISDGQGYDYTHPVIDNASKSASGDKYSAFIGGDNALTTINNPSITDGSSCVVIKESYGNAFVPFLTDHYQTVYVVDYRYYSMNNLTTFIQQNSVSDLIFLNHADAIRQSNAADMLHLFK